MALDTQPETRSSVYTQRTTCRACGAHDLLMVLSLGEQYVVGFVRHRDELLPRAPLDLAICQGCGLLQLKHTVAPDLMWRDYFYRSGINQTMRDALESVVDNGLQYHHEGIWVDIGANDGTLLARVPTEFTRVAFEPARNLQPLLQEHADVVVNDYFGPHPAIDHSQCQVITSCAMFYDLDDPNPFVNAVAHALAEDGVWINQLSDAPGMIRLNAWDAICHEHVCYYDLETLGRLYARHGLKIVDVSYNQVNGGSMRVIAQRGIALEPPERAFGDWRDQIRGFADRCRRWKDLMGWMIEALWMSGRSLYVYGASTKGSVILQYLDQNQRFRAIADRNPAKHGLLMAGTWLPIVSEEIMRSQHPDVLFCPIWAFRDEVLERERELRDRGATFLFPLPNPELVI
jgi:NDP-4-keto-2,6-dideoxyhexose 3-C-methyltransferase